VGVAVGVGEAVGVAVGVGVGAGVGRQRAIRSRGWSIVTQITADVGDTPEGKSPVHPSKPKSQLGTSPTIVPPT
jgi:hypothetical protein